MKYIWLYWPMVATTTNLRLQLQRTDLNEECHWIFGRSYQIEGSGLSQNFHCASLGSRLIKFSQWLSHVIFITTSPKHCTPQRRIVDGQYLTTMVASSHRSSGQDIGLVALLCYDQFEIGWLEPIQLRWGTIIPLVTLILVSNYNDRSHEDLDLMLIISF